MSADICAGNQHCDSNASTCDGELVTTPIASTNETATTILFGGVDEDARQYSTTLKYVRHHAHRAIEHMRQEDPNYTYIQQKSKSLDVRLYSKVRTCAFSTPSDYVQVDFRGTTRVPGALESIFELLASDEERESYWVALNTQRGLINSSLLSTKRVGRTGKPFPRWNQRHMVTHLSKQSTLPPMESFVTEYATYFEDDEQTLHENQHSLNDGLRRAYVYRRTMDQRYFDKNNEVTNQGDALKSEHDKLLIEDWLMEISETPEPRVCKVVLTCTVYFPGVDQFAQTKETEFREFCTDLLLNVREIFTNQWKDQMENAGMVGWKSRFRWGQSIRCGVCSSTFGLLKKRYRCNTCELMVCTQCCVHPNPSFPYGVLARASSLKRSNGVDVDLSNTATSGRPSVRECVLCAQYGAPSTTLRVPLSIRQAFTTSIRTSAPPIMITQTPEEQGNVVKVRRKARIRSSTDDTTHTTQWRNPNDRFPPSRIFQSYPKDTLELFTSESGPTTRRSSVVLISDIDQLSLTGRLSSGSADNCKDITRIRNRMAIRRSMRAVSEDTVLLPPEYLQQVEEADLGNFTLKLS